MKKLIIIAILGVLTSITPFTLKADYTSINQPVSELSSYTLSEVITDITTPLSQYIITQDPAFDILDHPFIDLNNHTLAEVFEDILIDWNRQLPNGVFTYQQRYDNGAYVLDRYVQEYTLVSGDITHLYTYESNVDMVGFNIPSNAYFIVGITLAAAQVIAVESRFPVAYLNSVNNIGGYSHNTSFQFLLFVAKDAYATIAEVHADLVGTKIWYQLATPILNVWTSSLTVEQMDFWYNIYNGTTVLDGLETLGSETYFFDDNVIYNIGEMVNDKIYSPLNNNTFDNLIEGTMQSQFNQWSTRELEILSTLSYQDYLFYDSDGTVADMLTWYNLYNTLVAQAEADALLIDDNELLTLIIALVLYIIGVVLALYLKNKMIFIGASLLWFIPIFIISNIFIILFSVIMIILSFVTAFFEKKTEDFD